MQPTQKNRFLVKDLTASFQFPEYWLYSTWMKFGLQYRKTTLGPLWLMISPAVFVIMLGFLFSSVNARPLDVFMPYMSVGYITWTLMVGIISNSTPLFHQRRSELLQGDMRLTDIVLSNLFTTFLQFLHQTPILIAVFIFFKITIAPLALLISLLGIILILLNGVWLSIVCGIIGTQFRDLAEVISAVMRLAFFITPIIWMHQNGAGGILGVYLVLNPFFHFLEVVRAPLLGNTIPQLTWIIVLSVTCLGYILAISLYRIQARRIPLWV